jgi:hypothetical protein
MFDFNVLDADRTRSARISLVALTLGAVLACDEQPERASGEGHLELVSTGRSRTGAPYRARGTVTVRGLSDGSLHVVPTSTEAGARELRVAPGLYGVSLSSDFDVEWLGAEPEGELHALPAAPALLVATPALVRVEPGSSTVVRIRFGSNAAGGNPLASERVSMRSALGYQDVAGSGSDDARVCRPMSNDCEPADPPPVTLPARRVLERYSR